MFGFALCASSGSTTLVAHQKRCGRDRVSDEVLSRLDTAIQDTSVEFLAHAHPIAKALLNTLSSFDLEYQQELERIRVGSSPQALKNGVLQRLQERHRARREPYLQQLAQLRNRAGAHP